LIDLTSGRVLMYEGFLKREKRRTNQNKKRDKVSYKSVDGKEGGKGLLRGKKGGERRPTHNIFHLVITPINYLSKTGRRKEGGGGGGWGRGMY